MSETVKRKITRNDIVDVVSTRNDAFFKGHIKVIVNATLDALAEAIATGKPVEIRRLGVFSTRRLPARRSRNPKTGEVIVAAPYAGVKYRASREIKRKLPDAGS